jgi:predicted nuclease with TOPRIM domain
MFGDAKLRKRVSELEEKLERIEHSFKVLQVEWTETYDKFRQLHWRVAKRAKQLEENTAESAEASSPPGDQGLSGSDVHPTSLSPRQAELQARILARRNHTTTMIKEVKQ